MTYKNHSRIAPVDLKVLAGRFENFSRFEPFDFSEHQFQLQRVEFIGPRACPTFPKPPWTRNTLSNKSVCPTLLYIPEGYTRGTCIGILHQFFHQQKFRVFRESGNQMLSQHNIRTESISDILSGRKYSFL